MPQHFFFCLQAVFFFSDRAVLAAPSLVLPTSFAAGRGAAFVAAAAADDDDDEIALACPVPLAMVPPCCLTSRNRC